MSAAESVLEQLNKTRSKLEGRFSEFEKYLLQSCRNLQQVPDKPLESSAPPHSLKVHEEVSLQGNEVRELQAQNKTLEETIECLRESLKVMATERQELSKQLHALEEQSKDFQKSHAENLDQTRSENVRLKQKIEGYQKRRSQSAHFWKSWIDRYRLKNKLLKNNDLKNEEYSKQITKLSGELDQAHELIAELRDELHSLGIFGPAQKENESK